MKPDLHRGQLTKWIDDRGFGFITPNDSNKKVFLHISALKGASCRPKIGDTIFYERITEPNGKVRAANAFIQGVAPPTLPPFKKTKKWRSLQNATGAAILLIFALFMQKFNSSSSSSSSPSFTSIASTLKPECTIKGNISVSTGNRVYHLPGMEDYESTTIDLAKGERWFCSESEALATGWRKAPR